MSIRVALIDDHALFLRGVRGALRDLGVEVVHSFVDPIEALAAIGPGDVDVVVSDLVLPNVDGIDLLQRLSQRGRVRLVLLTTYAGAGLNARAREAGVDAVLNKDIDPRRLVSILDALVQDPSYRLIPDDKSVPAFTARELQIVRALATGASNPEIAQQIGITSDTVKDHVTRVFAKLDVSERVSAVRRAIELGLVPGVPPVGGTR